ncbi:MAG: PQQ-binding-like beta-propeller repeat protein [Acidobacteria bacterium]|nr:PQQ-binding-like beta-propeller repeat protein [Acidobacteriota bacterium]
MTTATTLESTPRKQLRLWPGVVAAAIIVVLRFFVPLIVPGTEVYGILAGVAGLAVILLWWLFFSRAPWSERIGAVVLMIVATLATGLVVHESIAGGMMGRMLPVIAVPITLGPAFVAWAVLTHRLSDGMRRAAMVVTILLACGVWTLARTDGVKGEAGAQLHWRWTPTAEERLLAQANDEPALVPAAPAAPEIPKEGAAAKPGDKPISSADGAPATAATAPAAPQRTPPPPVVVKTSAEWPGFRGPRRDGVVRGVSLETDWSQNPPVQLWRRQIGPGWSSFAVDGDLFYTQEQRGDHEVVASYRVSTGEPVWRHRDAVRFYESNGGAGPRGTPTVHDGRIYSFGATGIVNALDARNGAVLWSRNAATDTGAKLPGWGFTSSPLVVNDAVIVAASGRLVAYELATGNQRWVRTTGGGGYSSPHPFTTDGVTQVVLLTGRGATGVAPADGTVLWDHTWDIGTAIVQPAVLPDGQILMALGDAMGGQGMRRLAISRGFSGWTVTERWTTRGLKPYFNDFVVHKGHAFGFDGTILSSINVDDGERKWKGGRYGAGQMVLLPDQDVLLVLSEEGELALVNATPDQFTELARFKAIEGKTWNHPVLVGDVLLVRNGEEMAAFRLPLANR